MGNPSSNNPDLTRPGRRQEEDGRTFRSNTGSAPNGVANHWLSTRIGKELVVAMPGGERISGVLIAFDSYSLAVKAVGAEFSVLVFKGPGVVICDAGV